MLRSASLMVCLDGSSRAQTAEFHADESDQFGSDSTRIGLREILWLIPDLIPMLAEGLDRALLKQPKRKRRTAASALWPSADLASRCCSRLAAFTHVLSEWQLEQGHFGRGAKKALGSSPRS